MSALSAYDVIIAPVITEKATAVSESNQGVFKAVSYTHLTLPTIYSV